MKSVPSAIHSIQASRRQLQLVDVLISSIRSTVCRTTSNSGRQGCGLVELYRFTTFFTITRKLFRYISDMYGRTDGLRSAHGNTIYGDVKSIVDFTFDVEDDNCEIIRYRWSGCYRRRNDEE